MSNSGRDGLGASIRRTIGPAEFGASSIPAQLALHSLLPLPSFQIRLSQDTPIHLLISPPEMVPTFHMNDFRPWAPPRKKLFSPHKSLNSPPPRTQNTARPKPYHNAPSSTLSVPKHHLPARPPAEVCVHQPCTPLNTDSEDPKHGPAPLQDLSPHILDPDPIPHSDLQYDTIISIEPPAFRGDFAEESPSSPSASGSDDSLEGFFRLPDAQDDTPIDPVILANHEPWADSGLQESAQQADSLINPETYPYPDPPPVLYGPPDLYRDSGEGAGGQNSDTQPSDHPRINNRQQVNPSEHDTHPDASYPDTASGKPHVGRQPKGSKRKMQQADGQFCKRCRLSSALPPRKDSFTTLRSHFASLPFDERLQFLSWLFEGALPRCMSDSSPTAYEDKPTRGAGRSNPPHEIEQNRPDGSSRKGMSWSSEEVDLLVKLRKDESRPWSEVTRLFWEQYPGRSSGAIQVFWSMNLNKKGEYN